MNFSNFWGMALISTIKISICDYGKGKKISVLIWHLVHDVDYIGHNDFFFLSVIWLYWVVHLESSQYNLTSKKKKIYK